MSGPRITAGVRVPLFDRLVETAAPDDLVDGNHDRRMLDRTGLKASIGRELARLLNTRTPLAADVLDRRPRSTVDYGLPDLSRFWPGDDNSENELARLIERTVAAFEPRLLTPRVIIERVAGQRRALRALVSGSIVLNAMVEPVTFPVLVNDATDRSYDA
jgi:type VI secretion system protein ImpF